MVLLRKESGMRTFLTIAMLFVTSSAVAGENCKPIENAEECVQQAGCYWFHDKGKEVCRRP
jgi:hypothetical protein